MDRRDFLKTTGSAAAAVSVTGAAASSQAHAEPQAAPSVPHIHSGVRELTLALPAPDNGRGLAENARRLARRIEALTGGTYRISAISGEAAHDTDMQHGSAHDYLSANPAFAYFAGLPGEHGLPISDLDAWMAVGGGQALWDDLSASHGFKALLAGYSGSNPAIWSRRPLTDRHEMQGLRYAAEGLASDVARGLGAHSVRMTPGTLTATLNEDRADIVEGPGAMLAMAAGLPEVAPFALEAGINRYGAAQSLAIKSSVWEQLTEAHRAAFETAAAEEFRLCQAEVRAHETLAWRVIRSRHNVNVSQPTLQLVDAINRVSDGVVAHLAASSRQAQRINASFMAFRAMLPVIATEQV
jgi:TRAP-type mannitol/chloroaromatic compound transport system substrate-binding protein